nr:ribonuclease R [Neobittarella massiliensis]
MQKTIEKILRETKNPYVPLKLICTRAASFSKPQIRSCLDQMEKSGQVLFGEQGFALPERLDLKRGEIVKVAGSFGFAQLDDEEKTQVFIPGRYFMGAMTGEQVLLRTRPGRVGMSLEGEVVQVIPDPDGAFVGVLHLSGDSCFVVLDCMPKTEIKVRRSTLGEAKDGDKVLVKLVVRGRKHFGHIAAIERVFGDSGRAKFCADAILHQNHIKLNFEPETLQEAAQVFERGVCPDDFAGREDLRDWVICTIDSKETKDIDDAISLQKTADGYQLGVHIADVSHYVRPDTALDSEAFERGTSVYYANSVVPMLPKELSNGVCSLNPDEDRLALSCIAQLDEQGHIKDYRFAKTIIRSRKKCAYSEVNALLDGTASPDIVEAYAQVIDSLQLMGQLAQILEDNRFARGAMNIESNESKIIMDEEGDPVDIVVRDRGASEKAIEELMLIANECAANLGRKNKLPFVYRVHEDPDGIKLETLRTILKAFGYPYTDIKAGVPTKKLAEILDLSRGKPEQILIHKMVLRSMAKAKYSEQPLGHYSLSLDDYAHFTSPIRRYPDLSIHRIITDFLSGVPASEIRARYDDFVVDSSAHSTQCEINAMMAERDCDDAYKAQYMQQFIGQDMPGIVSGVAPYGFYVQLENSCEGLVRLATIEGSDYELVDDIKLVDHAGGKTISIGDPITVKTTNTNVSLGQVDFALV